MTSYVDLERSNKVNFTLFQLPQSKKGLLTCDVFRDEYHRISVKVLEGRVSAQPSEGDVEVRVTLQDGRKVRLSVNVKDVAANWRIPEEVVRERCLDNAFETLPFKSQFPLKGSTEESSVEEKECDSEDLSDSDNEKSSPPATPAVASPISWLLGDSKSPKRYLDSFPFLELKKYLTNKGAEQKRLEKWVQEEWGKIKKCIGQKQEESNTHCEENGLKSYIYRDPGFTCVLEFFHDGWGTVTGLHFKCAGEALVLNPQTGMLFQLKDLNDIQAVTFRQIQMLARRCPYIEPHKISSIKETPSVLVPLFSLTFEEALRSRYCTWKDRDQMAQGWIEGLEALHAAGIAHQKVGPSSFRVRINPVTHAVIPFIGEFGDSFLIDQSNPREDLLAKDVHQLGKFLRAVYNDLFVQGMQIPTSSQVYFSESKRATQIPYWIDKMLSEDLFLRPKMSKILAAWKQLPDD